MKKQTRRSSEKVKTTNQNQQRNIEFLGKAKQNRITSKTSPQKIVTETVEAEKATKDQKKFQRKLKMKKQVRQ